MRQTVSRAWAVGLCALAASFVAASLVAFTDRRVSGTATTVARFTVGISLLLSFVLLRIMTDAADGNRYRGVVGLSSAATGALRRTVQLALLGSFLFSASVAILRTYRPDFGGQLLDEIEDRPEALMSAVGILLGCMWLFVALFGVNALAAPKRVDSLPFLFRVVHRLLPGQSIQKEIIEKEERAKAQRKMESS